MSINSIFAGSTPNSRDTLRQQYLNNLTLDIANMTKNLNANRLFKANGSTGSEPADTRSATERYADLDALKVQVRAGLKQITDGMEAENIVADITTAELQFLAGYMPFIVADLKPKFSLGVPAGSFLPYLRKLMRKNIETEGVDYGFQTASNVSGGIETTASSLISSREIEDLGQELGRSGRGASSRRDEALEKKMLEMLRQLDELRPTMVDREIIASLHDPYILDEYDNDVATIAQNLPSANVIRDAFRVVPYQAKVARFDAIFNAVDFEMMRSLKVAISEIRRNMPQDRQIPEYGGEDLFGDENSGLTPLGGTTIQEIPRLEGAEQSSTVLPSAYIRPSTEKLTQLSSFAEEITPEDFNDQTYNTKMELLRSYADEGKFNEMDASFLHMINAIEQGIDVPERDMVSGYSRFFRLKQLGGLTDKGEMPQLPPSKVFQTEQYPPVEQYPPTRQPTYQFEDESEMPEEERDPISPQTKYTQPPYSNFGSMSAKTKRLLLTQMLSQGEFSEIPDFEDVATEIVSTKNVPDEYLSNFFNAFLHHIGVGGAPLVAMPEEEDLSALAVALPKSLEEEEFEIEVPPRKGLPSIPEDTIDFDEFQSKTRAEQYNYMQTLTNIPENLQANFAGLKPKAQKKTMEYLYQQYLHYKPSPLTPKALKQIGKSSDKKASSSASTEAEKYSSPNKSDLSGETVELGATPSTPSGKIHFPRDLKEFEKLTIGKQQAVLDRAFAEGFFEDESGIYDTERATQYIEAERKSSWKNLFKRDYEQAYSFILPLIIKLRAEGTLGMGLPAPHHVLGPNGYGIKPQGRPMMQTMGGKLPTNKKKGNIIFGMGLASVVPQPKVKVEGKNINLTAGIEAEPAYVKFGTHLLNKHRLKDNVVMMRTMKGGAIVNIPTQKVSSKLARVLHTISGGAIPAFESVMDLTDGDKALLHQIAKTSKVSDRLSVPNPNKSKLEEEDNRFNILRGEVSIGNDNPAVIKEFKVLLLKFMREGRVPTGQGKAIMEELLLLGY